MTTAEAAVKLGIEQRSVRALIERGRLKAKPSNVKRGQSVDWNVSRASVEARIAARNGHNSPKEKHVNKNHKRK